jgi:hypothetical protein
MSTTPNQTAVDWLQEQLTYDNGYGQRRQSFTECADLSKLFEEAREMDIQQKEYMFNCGRQFQLTGECTFKQVMDKTYGKSE